MENSYETNNINNLAFRGSSTKLSIKHNGNILGFLQLLGLFDPTMIGHLRQIEAKEQQVQMLSVTIQNEMIKLFACQGSQPLPKK